MRPRHWRVTADSAAQIFFRIVVGFVDFPGEVQIIPANDAVLDEAVTGFGDLLFFLLGLCKFAGIADGDGTGKAVGQFDFVELLLNGLPNAKSSI